MSIWDCMARGDACHLTVVAYGSALFHPKVAHVIRADGAEAAMVGSANLTSAALGANVEAWVEVSSGTPADNGILAEIVRATDWWHSSNESGVFQIASSVDADRLLERGILITRQVQRERSSTFRTTAIAARGSRSHRWSAALSSQEIAEEEGEQLDDGTDPTSIVRRWCKKLSRSDALQTGTGTNPTGTLRLARARHQIDQNTWFREQLFGSARWVSVSRRNKAYKEAHITFNVEFPGRDVDQQDLLVDHAPHRAAGQHNVVTLLHWGATLGQWLRGHNQAGNWVIIECDDRDEHWLRIEDTAPSWAPGQSA